MFTPEDDSDSMTSSPQDDTESQSTLEDSNGQVRWTRGVASRWCSPLRWNGMH